MRIEEIEIGQQLHGLTRDGWAGVVAVMPRGGGAVEVTHRDQ